MEVESGESIESADAAPPRPSTRVTVTYAWPFEFTADLLTGQRFVTSLGGDAPVEREVSRDDWRDLIAAAQAGALSQIADALDDTYAVRGGELPSIAHSLASIAAHSCPHGGDDLDAFPSKSGAQEPS